MLELFDVFAPELPDATLKYYPNFLNTKEADLYLEKLTNETPWRNDPITVFGKTYPQPRMTSLHGHTTDSYGYSGIVMQPNPMSKPLLDIKQKLHAFTKEVFTTVLLNLYRDGQDSNGWHADNEKKLGINPVIASVSLGASRFFHLKHNNDKSQRLKLELTHGSLLLMEGATQHFWKHQIAKTAKKVNPRINLTFRKVLKVH